MVIVVSIHQLVQQKMHCALRRTCGNIQKDEGGEKSILSRESLEQSNFNASPKDCEVSSIVLKNSNHSCAILTFFAPEPNGHWRIVALPLQCLDRTIHLGSGSQVNKDGLHLVSPSPVCSLKAHRHNAQRASATDGTCSHRTLTSRSFSELNFQHQSRDKGLANKEDKAVKRISRKKVKKKGKRNKKFSGDTGLTELECAHGSSSSQTCANKGIANGVGPLPNPDNPCSNVFSKANDSLLLDSVSLGSSSDKSCNIDYEFKVSNEESARIDVSKSPGQTRKGCPSLGSMLNGVVDSNSHAETANCGRQVCTSGDRHLVRLEKIEKEIKGVPNSSSFYRNVENLPGRFVKEKNQSVWQKVQRNDAGKCNYELKKVNSVCSQFDIGLKEDPLLKNHRNVVPLLKNHRNLGSNACSNSEDKNKTKLKVSGKLKRKTSLGSKQECKYYLRKGSHALKTSSNLYARINTRHNAISDIPARMSGQKELDTLSRSHSKISPSIGFQTNRGESITSEPVHSSHFCPNELEQPESVYTTISTLTDQNAENQTRLLSRSCSSLDPTELLADLSAVHLHTLVDDEGAKIETEVSTEDQSKQETSSGAILQEWVPVGIEDYGLASLSKSGGLSMAKLDESVGKSWTLQNIAEQELASDSHTLVSSRNSRASCTGKGSEIVCVSPSNDVVPVQKSRNQRICIPKEYCNNYAVAKCLIPESEVRNLSASENDSSNIACAVNDAYRAQLASEAIQIATGCPIAEFERLLHSVAPVIFPSRNIVRCQTCLRKQVVGASLCRHETPDISLGSLWKWYEKHGSYGLEVSAEDYENSERLGIDHISFHAYFVPFLSAVQLFRKCKGNHTDNSNGIPGTEATEASGMYTISKNSSDIGHLPIFSVLVPQPRSQNSTFHLSQKNHVCYSEPSSVCSEDNVSIQPVDSRWSDDLELLFEYFESEPPQKRRPLYEMIKDLVRGDGPSQRRAYGDATILDSVGLHDLHPKSWYSVAWYPIYRIPDGNFRAAFLTYHSLGHLVHRACTFGCICVDASIVSPVVGLQSYNAKGECWFQPRYSAHGKTAEVSNSNPAGILRERLRTLEQTASLMARAIVSKGNQTYVNRQPDYEFFLSRRRW